MLIVLLAKQSQKRPDVHKIVLSIELRFFPPKESVNLEDFATDFSKVFFLILDLFVFFFEGGGGSNQILRPQFGSHIWTFLTEATCHEGGSLRVLFFSFERYALSPPTSDRIHCLARFRTAFRTSG